MRESNAQAKLQNSDDPKVTVVDHVEPLKVTAVSENRQVTSLSAITDLEHLLIDWCEVQVEPEKNIKDK